MSGNTVTDYVNGCVYEGGTLKFFGSPEGRVVRNGPGQYEYQYSIADHQGNTRVVFTSAAPVAEAPVATFEGDANDQSSQYQVVPANVVSFISANHTVGGNKVVRLNQNYKTGPSRSIKVFPGDAVDLEVWAYYEGTSGWGSNNTGMAAFVTSVASGFGGAPSGSLEGQAIYNGVSSAIGQFGMGGNQGDSRPSAYLNFILFDKDYKLLDMGWTPVPESANMNKQKLSIPTVKVTEPGYIFVYLSYEAESNNWVYFDDLKVTHTKTRVLQYNEYYPFGLQTSTSWTREGHKNDFLYNAGNELNAYTGWYETMFRGYDAALGRFLQVDPLAASYGSWSPYNYAYSDPVNWNDPLGLSGVPGHFSTAEDLVNELFNRAGSNGGRWTSGGGFYSYTSSQEAYGAASQFFDEYGWGNSYYYSKEGSDEVFKNWQKTGHFPSNVHYKYKYNISTRKGGNTGFEYIGEGAQQGDPFGFGREDLNNSYYTVRSDYTRMKHLLGEFLSGEGPERSLFYGSHPLTKGMKNSAVVQRAKEFYAKNYPNGGDMVRAHFDFFATDVPFVGSDIEQFVGSARVSIYQHEGLSIFVIDNTTGRYSGSFDTAQDIPRIPGQITPMGNIYQRFIWIEE